MAPHAANPPTESAMSRAGSGFRAGTDRAGSWTSAHQVAPTKSASATANAITCAGSGLAPARSASHSGTIGTTMTTPPTQARPITYNMDVQVQIGAWSSSTVAIATVNPVALPASVAHTTATSASSAPQPTAASVQ